MLLCLNGQGCFNLLGLKLERGRMDVNKRECVCVWARAHTCERKRDWAFLLQPKNHDYGSRPGVGFLVLFLLPGLWPSISTCIKVINLDKKCRDFRIVFWKHYFCIPDFRSCYFQTLCSLFYSVLTIYL